MPRVYGTTATSCRRMTALRQAREDPRPTRRQRRRRTARCGARPFVGAGVAPRWPERGACGHGGPRRCAGDEVGVQASRGVSSVAQNPSLALAAA